MDTPIWDLDFSYKGPQCVKISCHGGDLGSRALCNMIGDQPLFYIDDSADDDFAFMEHEFDEMDAFPTDEKFLEKMRAKLESYDKTAKTLSQYEISSAESEFDRVFLSGSLSKQTLKSILNYGEKSAIFQSYFHFMIEHRIKIELSNDIKTSFYCRNESKIYVNQSLDCETACMALMKSMRMAWRHKKGLAINPLSFQPEEAVLMNRIMEADLDVAATAFLWDMKLAGEERAWTRAMSGSNHDLCATYAMEAMTDFRSIKGGLAARATFEKWFLSARCKNTDRQIIQTLMGSHTDIFIQDADVSRVIAADIIASMGQRPDGQNYLAPIAVQIMNDPLFGEVRDRSNANFLWFVTFERRMAYVERDLQEGEEQTKKRSTKELENNVLSLPQQDEQCSKQASNQRDGNASIFFLDHFRAG